MSNSGICRALWIAGAVQLVLLGTANAETWYVKPGGAGTGNVSWSNAFGDLQDALGVATGGDQVWVASGVYTPGTLQTDSFVLHSGVQITGGYSAAFNGDTTRNPDPFTNNTILSGDLGGVHSWVVVSGSNLAFDTQLSGFRITGAEFHAIEVWNQSEAVFKDLLIDQNTDTGFGGAGAFIDASPVKFENCWFEDNESDSRGGAVYCTNGQQARFVGCTFRINSAFAEGGAVYIDTDAYPVFEDTTFLGNRSLNGAPGGAIYVIPAQSSQTSLQLIINRCEFQSNDVTDLFLNGSGGAIAIFGGLNPAQIKNSAFYGNYAGDGGAAIWVRGDAGSLSADVVSCFFGDNRVFYEGGAILANGSLNVTNCVFSGNKAFSDELGADGFFLGRGGAISHTGGALSVVNCTFSGNEIMGWRGGAFFSNHMTSASLLANCILWNNWTDAPGLEVSQIVVPDPDAIGNHFDIRDCSIQFLNSRRHTLTTAPLPTVAGAGNSAIIPKFVDEFGPSNNPGSLDSDVSLLGVSRCIDRGDNNAVPQDATDVDGDGIDSEDTPDFVLAERVASGAHGVAELGCGERTVDLGAYEYANLDCNGNQVPDAIEIEECNGNPDCTDSNNDGIIDMCQDCDMNGTPDPVDISEFGANDCNGNCIPDACEDDCNTNGVPDDCDLAVGTSDDCDLNGVPDECDPDCDENGVPDGYEAPVPADTVAREFVFAFSPAEVDLNGLVVELHLISAEDTEVTITYPMNSTDPADRIFTSLEANVVSVVSLPGDASLGWVAGAIQSNAVHVEADQDIRCIQIAGGQFQTDASIAYPVDALGTEYIAVTNDFSSALSGPLDRPEFIVVATRDGTLVTITPTDDSINAGGPSHPADVPFQITLDRGEGYLVQPITAWPATPPTPDLTGSTIAASKPVFVINGNRCATVPSTNAPCDPIFETAHPVSAWGSEYIAPNLPARAGVEWPSIYRILASVDNTTVLMDGVSIGLIDRGEFIEQDVSGDHVFSSQSGEPIFVAQFMRSANTSDPANDRGDPAMVNLLPKGQFAMDYAFTTAINLVEGLPVQFPHHFAMIVASDADALLGGITLDGAIIPSGDFTPIGTSGYRVARVPLNEGLHATASLIEGHCVIVGGWGTYDSYLYPAGAANIRPRGADVDCNANGIIDDCECILGDLNGDGIVNSKDLDAFKDCYKQGDPTISNCYCADMDQNGILDTDDIDCFVSILLGGAGCGGIDPCVGEGTLLLTLVDCNENGIEDAVDIANGTSADCNENGTPDECEIGTEPPFDLPDCNNNGVPDTCELSGNDCNGNGILDECEISSGLSDDVNQNGVPDFCEPELVLGGNAATTGGPLGGGTLGGGSLSGASTMTESEKWSAYLEWCFLTDFDDMTSTEKFEALLAKRLELGLPAGQLLPTH